MTCGEIEILLPACLDDLLSPEERRGVEAHLASCERCRLAFANFRQAGKIVGGLGEVEPPPFFEQRIMSRIREEAAGKPGIIRKLFHPLHIKIPIQALAAVCIVVLALQVYRTSEPEMKGVANLPLPMAESEKGRIAVESPLVPKAPPIQQAPAASFPGTPAARGGAGDLPVKDRQGIASPPAVGDGRADRMADSPKPAGEGFAPAIKSGIPSLVERGGSAPAVKPGIPVMAAREAEAPAAAKSGIPNLAARKQEASPTGVGTEASDRPLGMGAEQRTGPAGEAPPAERKRVERESGAVADRAKMAAAPAPSRETARDAVREPDIDLTIRAGDPGAAVREIEEALGGFGGRIIGRQRRGGGEILAVEISADRVPLFLDRLEAVGTVRPEKPSRTTTEGKTTLRIAIVPNR